MPAGQAAIKSRLNESFVSYRHRQQFFSEMRVRVHRAARFSFRADAKRPETLASA
jgi:hypothetical protein